MSDFIYLFSTTNFSLVSLSSFVNIQTVLYIFLDHYKDTYNLLQAKYSLWP